MWGLIGVFMAGVVAGLVIFSLLCQAAKNSREIDDSERWEKMRQDWGGEGKDG